MMYKKDEKNKYNCLYKTSKSLKKKKKILKHFSLKTSF